LTRSASNPDEERPDGTEQVPFTCYIHFNEFKNTFLNETVLLFKVKQKMNKIFQLN